MRPFSDKIYPNFDGSADLAPTTRISELDPNSATMNSANDEPSGQMSKEGSPGQTSTPLAHQPLLTQVAMPDNDSSTSTGQFAFHDALFLH